MDNSIYEVTRDDYKAFVEQIKRGCGRVEIVTTKSYQFSNIISQKTGKRLCGRKTYINNNNKNIPEKYYIYEMPDDDERCKPIPKLRLNLETREEVQAFFNILSKMNKEKNNG